MEAPKKTWLTLLVEREDILMAAAEKGGELDEQLLQMLDFNSFEITEKCDRTALLIMSLQHEYDMAIKMVEKYQKLAKFCKNTESRVKSMLLERFKIGDVESAVGFQWRIKRQKMADKVICNEELDLAKAAEVGIPGVRQKIEYSWDKDFLKTYLANNEHPHARLEPNWRISIDPAKKFMKE